MVTLIIFMCLRNVGCTSQHIEYNTWGSCKADLIAIDDELKKVPDSISLIYCARTGQ